MTRSPRTTSTARRRVLAATATLGVVAVMGGVPAAYADDDPGAAGPAQAAAAGQQAGSGGDGASSAPADDASDAPSDAPSDTPSDDPSDEPSDGTSPTPEPSSEPSPSEDQPSADPTPSQDEPGDQASAQPTTEATDGEGADTATSAVVIDDPFPDFGQGKYRVGVRIADGSFVPPGTTTAGSTLVVSFSDGSPSTTCTTGDAEDDGSSYCSVVGPQGGTVTVTQQGANADLVAGPAVSAPGCTAISLPPLRRAAAKAAAAADEVIDIDGLPCFGDDDIVVTDTGTPPSATDDSAKTAASTPVDVDVLANDDNGNGAPTTSTTISTAPGHGTASFVATGSGGGMAAITGGPVVRYVPAAGFNGTDRFRYTVSTANGSATGTVTVTVGTPAAPRPPQQPTTPTKARVAPAVAAPTGALPDTGGPDGRLLGLGAALLGAGGVVTVVGRRRRATQH